MLKCMTHLAMRNGRDQRTQVYVSHSGDNKVDKNLAHTNNRKSNSTFYTAMSSRLS